MRKLHRAVVIVWLAACGLTAANGQAVSRKEILDAVHSGGRYITEVLLDDNGKSRCEYSLITGQWQDYEPAWHTGQLVYALVRAFDITDDERYLAAAKKAGNWWCGLQITDHPKLNGMLKAIHGAGIDYIVFATVSDGTAGLFNLQRRTGIDTYAAVATEAGKWMYENLYLEKEGLCYDMVDPETGEVQTKRSLFWPDKTEQDLFDVARPNNEGSIFLDMYRYTGDEKYRDAFINLCNSVVEKQGEEGLWMDFTPNDKAAHSIHPRFNLWYAESLLDGYELTGEEKYLKAALRTARYYSGLQKADGTFYYRNYTDGTPPEINSICGSAVSFSGIIWLRLLKYGHGAEFEKNIESSVQWVLNNRFSEDHPDENLSGGFINTRSRVRKGKMTLVNRDVGTGFGVRFLADYYDYITEK